MSHEDDFQQDFEEIKQDNRLPGALVHLPVSLVNHNEKQIVSHAFATGTGPQMQKNLVRDHSDVYLESLNSN